MTEETLEQTNTPAAEVVSLPAAIEFVNMKPWSDLKAEGDSTMEKIGTQSPSDANVKGELQQVDGGYLCHISVVSPIWKFDVKEFARNPLTALQRAARSVEQELSLWKKWRFIGAQY